MIITWGSHFDTDFHFKVHFKKTVSTSYHLGLVIKRHGRFELGFHVTKIGAFGAH